MHIDNFIAYSGMRLVVSIAAVMRVRVSLRKELWQRPRLPRRSRMGVQWCRVPMREKRVCVRAVRRCQFIYADRPAIYQFSDILMVHPVKYKELKALRVALDRRGAQPAAFGFKETA